MSEKLSGVEPPLVPLSYSILEHRPRYAHALGMITIEIGRLEMSLGEMLAALLHIDRDFGHVIYLTPQANMARLSIIENVARESFLDSSPSLKRILGFVARAKAAMSKRHEYVHDVWGVSDDDPDKVTRRSLPYKRGKPERIVPIEELTALIQKIRILVHEVRQETEVMFHEWPPYTWQGKPRERPESGISRSTLLPESDPPKPVDPSEPSRSPT